MEELVMSKLVPPHGGKGLVCCLLEGKALEDELQKAKGLKVNGKTYNHSAAKALNINL